MNRKNQKRLAKDVIDIIKNPLHNNGIYYKHDDDDMLKGYALIIGPDETIYNYGYYLFQFKFKKEYPYKPPIVEYLTNENNIRFHPNLYRNGKVCLSLLNTWSGEQWTSCQTIRTILLNLVTLFHNKPLLNEPGITEKYKYFKEYNDIIKYSNYNTAIVSFLKNKIKPEIANHFNEYIKKRYLKNKDDILKQLIELKKLYGTKLLQITLYSNMNCLIDYNKLYDKFLELNLN
jgi:ubiquitin-protein ligase|tara:strand:- start:526 stop:1221 length:696 start_codon:yes stop_codon:yes gene_type:complete